MTLSSYIHVAADGITSFFNGWVTFHCTYVPHCLYPFICRWTFRLFPCLGYCEWCCNEHWGACIFWIIVLSRYMPRIGIAGSNILLLSEKYKVLPEAYWSKTGWYWAVFLQSWYSIWCNLKSSPAKTPENAPSNSCFLCSAELCY